MIGVAQEATLPKLTLKTVSYRAGGMLAPVSVDLELDDGALDMEVTVSGMVMSLLSRMYEDTADSMQLRFSWRAIRRAKSRRAAALPRSISARPRWVRTPPVSPR